MSREYIWHERVSVSGHYDAADADNRAQFSHCSSMPTEKLTHTKKFQRMLDTKDLYAVPVSAIPGCGFLLGMLLKREGISRASDLYEMFKKQNRKAFTEYLQCKLGKWNGIYVNVGKQTAKLRPKMT